MTPLESLPAGVRHRMEQRLGHGFSEVRVRQSRDDASTVGAQAWTLGNEITFARGAYRPDTPRGDWLIAHELAHTVHQRGSRDDGMPPAARHSRLEAEANEAGRAVVEHAPRPVLSEGTGRGVQRAGGDLPFSVVPEMLAEDRNRRFLDPADGKVKPVWTPEGGYVKNPTATPLTELLEKGKVGRGFDNGVYTYVVDGKGEVILAKRLGEPGAAAGRATGMPHPTLIGGKNPTVLAAGDVEIRGGRIFRIDNQSGHFQPARKALGPAAKAFLRAPTTAFHPEFHAESVHYAASGERTTRPFRSLSMLKLRVRDLKRALRGLKPRAIAGKLRGRAFRSGAKTIAGLLAIVALQYFLGRLMQRIENELIEQQVDRLAPEVEAALVARSDELEALLEADSEADVYVNARFKIATFQMPAGGGAGPKTVESLPTVFFVEAGWSRQPWDQTPVEQFEVSCTTPVQSTIVTGSQAVSPKELFTDGSESDAAAGAVQPTTK